MTAEIVPSYQNLLALAGNAANHAASGNIFADYRARKAANTLRRQDADLNLFVQFLAVAGIILSGNLALDPGTWQGITWGIVQAFREWQLQQGYAVPSINVHLSTIKVYCKLAMKASVLTPAEYSLIRTVDGYQHKEIKRMDSIRTGNEIPIRRGKKKALPVSITKGQAGMLKK